MDVMHLTVACHDTQGWAFDSVTSPAEVN